MEPERETSPVEPDGPLRRLYESPVTPLASGAERARLQGEMLAEITAEITRRDLRAAVVVDVGCGDGTATATAKEISAKRSGANGSGPASFVGVDWSTLALEQARARGVAAVRGSVEAPGLPFGDASVDVVVMSELIEHLVDPDSALCEAQRVLVPGGSLLLSTPNLAAWFNRGLLLLGVQPLFSEVSLRGIYGRPGSQVVGHLRLFTRRALEQLLVARGFSEVSVSGAPYHDVPRPLRPLDRMLCRAPSLASILLASARKPSEPRRPAMAKGAKNPA